MRKIKIAIVGVGNCASSLVQGIEFYKQKKTVSGLAYPEIGGYRVSDIEIVAAFDIDKRKVGKNINEAIYAMPNCTMNLSKGLRYNKIKVKMGQILDGVSRHMKKYDPAEIFQASNAKSADIVKELKMTKAEILLNYLPVGAEKATRFYAQCCLDSGTAFVNNIPVFIASDPLWGDKFKSSNIPLIGDDIKSQLGATVLHRMIMRLFEERGISIISTYQLNIGGNTDFLNMVNPGRLKYKKISKTEAVQSQLSVPLNAKNIHVEPSGYVPWLKDNKHCFITIEGKGFAGAPLKLDLKLSVEDSPNSSGIVVDAIRCCKLALDRKIGGVLTSVSAYAMKHPQVQYPEFQAKNMMEDFISGKTEV